MVAVLGLEEEEEEEKGLEGRQPMAGVFMQFRERPYDVLKGRERCGEWNIVRGCWTDGDRAVTYAPRGEKGCRAGGEQRSAVERETSPEGSLSGSRILITSSTPVSS